MLLLFIASTGVFAQNSLDNPVAYWPFDGTVGDSSGNEIHGTIVGDVTFEQGVIGQAIKSVGTLEEAGYVDLGKHPDDALHDITTEFSISFWYKNDTSINENNWYHPIISDGGAFSITSGYYHDPARGDTVTGRFNPDWNFFGYTSQDSGATWIENTWDKIVYPDYSPIPHNGEWHHFTFAYSLNDSILYQYMDGELFGKSWIAIDSDIFNKHDTIRSVQILHDPRETGRYLPVYLDELRIYDYSVSMSEAKQLYEMANRSIQEPVAYWPFDGNVEDASGNEIDGTVVGDVTYNQGVVGQSIKSVGTPEDAGYVDLGKHPDDAIHDITTEFSIAFWYKDDTTINENYWWHPVISDGGAFSVASMHYFDPDVGAYTGRFTPDWNFFGYTSQDSGATWIENTWDKIVYPGYSDVPHNGEWHHFVLSYSLNDSILYQYMDGELFGKSWVAIEDDIFNKNDTIRSIWILGDPRDPRFLPVHLDELRIYDYSLNSIEVDDLYEFRAAVDTIDPIGGLNLAFTDTSINLNWDASDAANGYRVFRSINNGVTFLEVANIEDGDSTLYLDKDYILDRETFYYVKGYNEMFISDASDTVSITKPTISDEPATGSWDAPIAYWPFDGDFEDKSGNGQHGTEVNSVNFVQGAITGQAIKPEGTVEDAGYVDLGKNPDDAIHDITTDFSIAFWYKDDTTINENYWWHPVISDGGAFSVASMHYFDPDVGAYTGRFTPDWNFFGYTSQDSGATWIENTWDKIEYPGYSPIPHNGEWHHFVLSYSQSESILYQYMDGELFGKSWAMIDDDIFNKNDTMRSIYILGDPRDPRFLPVHLDELRIYDYGLDADDVSSLYAFEGVGEEVDAPTNVSVAFTDPNITVSWDAVDGATGYRVFRSINQGNTYLEVGNIEDGTTTEYIDTDVYDDRELFYYVKAYNEVNISDPSETVSINLTGIESNAMDKTSIYPNPASDFINIESPIAVESVEVYNLIGIKVMSVNPSDSAHRLNIQTLPAGVYLIKVKSTAGSALRRISVVK